MMGEWMAREMAAQPDVLARLVARRDEIRDGVRELVDPVVARPLGVQFAARGSSANAALHGRLVAELSLHRPATVASSSVSAAYGVDVDLAGWLGVTIPE